MLEKYAYDNFFPENLVVYLKSIRKGLEANAYTFSQIDDLLEKI